jgi:hypothetical protein
MGLLGTNPLYGALYESQPTGILSQPQPQGLLGAATVNPLMARQIAAQRAANPRPDVTDFMGYGPTWQTYLQNMNTNLQAQLPQMDDSGAVMAQKAAGMLGNFGGFGITAYHGSPHRFEKFSTSKIGTGEGAQAYGHGLYFAENPSVARGYRDKLSDDTKSGHLYKVDIKDDEISKMLDWDKPLSQQPENIRQALQPIIDSTAKSFPGIRSGDPTGQALYQLYVAHRGGNQQAASEVLKSAGIPGIRYLDQGSRTGGKGTSNYVVFDDQLPKIVGRE